MREAPREASLHAKAAQFEKARAATLAAIDAQQWGAALAASRSSCALCTEVVPPNAPAVGIEHLRLAKLLAHEGSLADAVDSWRRARQVLAVTHGSGSALVRSLEEELHGAEQELRHAGGGRSAAMMELA